MAIKWLESLLGNKHAQEKSLVQALDGFVQGFNSTGQPKLTEARENLYKGLVEIVSYGGHSSNGLLITEDGYFLTARHCLANEALLKSMKIRTPDGKLHQMEKVHAANKANNELDLALAKADLDGDCVPIRYRFYTEDGIDSNMPVVIFTRWDGKAGLNCGFVKPGYNQRHIVTSITTESGDSGGIIATTDFRIMGIHIGAYRDTEYYSRIAARISKAMDLVEFYKSTIERKMQSK